MSDPITAARVHAAIERAFLLRGGSPEQWQRVNADPRKFNRAWRRVLDLPDCTHPPPASLRTIDPLTGEDLSHDRNRPEHGRLAKRHSDCPAATRRLGTPGR